MRILSILVLSSVLFAANCAQAQNEPKKVKSIYWSDGDTRGQLWRIKEEASIRSYGYNHETPQCVAFKCNNDDGVVSYKLTDAAENKYLNEHAVSDEKLHDGASDLDTEEPYFYVRNITLGEVNF